MLNNHIKNVENFGFATYENDTSKFWPACLPRILPRVKYQMLSPPEATRDDLGVSDELLKKLVTTFVSSFGGSARFSARTFYQQLNQKGDRKSHEKSFEK